MTLDLAPSAAKLLLTYDHENCPPIDVNLDSNGIGKVLDFLQFYIEKNTSFRDEVAITGKKAVGSCKPWTSVVHFNHLIDQLREVEAILLAKGAVNGDIHEGFRTSFLGTIDRLPRVVNKKPPYKPLNFDISCLFGKDLTHGENAPAWYRSNPFHIKDDLSRMHEAHTTKEHLRSDGGIKPEVGHLVKIYCNLPNKAHGFVCGKVIETFPVPSDANLKRTRRTSDPTNLYGMPCPIPAGCGHSLEEGCYLTKNGTRYELLSKYGALHTQEVKCRVALATNMFDGDDASFRAFFGFYTKFIVTLRFKDDRLHRWLAVRIDSQEG